MFLFWSVLFLAVSLAKFDSLEAQVTSFRDLKLTRFAFGSCAKGGEGDAKKNVFHVVNEWKPQLFVLAGKTRCENRVLF